MTSFKHQQYVSYIYLIREREFLNNDDDVYKVGRTTQYPDNIIHRLRSYKKKSEIILVLQCDPKDVVELETTIKRQFRKRFKSHPDGTEYFRGDKCEMIRCIYENTIESINKRNNVDADNKSEEFVSFQSARIKLNDFLKKRSIQNNINININTNTETPTSLNECKIQNTDVNYSLCSRCHKEFTTKHDVIRHLEKKKSCDPIYSNKSREQCIEEFRTIPRKPRSNNNKNEPSPVNNVTNNAPRAIINNSCGTLNIDRSIHINLTGS